MSLLPPDEPEFEDPDRELKEKADTLVERAGPIEDIARRIGLYLEGTQIVPVETPFGPKPALVVDFLIGDLAWHPRTQDPTAADFDQQFKVMEAEMLADEFRQTQERIQKAIDEGRDPFDDEDQDLGH